MVVSGRELGLTFKTVSDPLTKLLNLYKKNVKMNKKELKKQYKQTVLPMGVFQVKNLTSGKIFIDAGINKYTGENKWM